MATGGGENLGTAYGDVVIRADGVRAGMAQAQAEFRSGIQGMSSMVTNFGNSVSALGSNLTMMTAPLVVAFGTGINAAATFDSAMTEISARTGIVGEDLQQVSEYAQQMGAETVFSAQDAAEGLLQLLSSGQTLEQAMSTLPMVMQAAAASGEDLGMTADMVTNVMASFGVGIDRLDPATRALADSLGITNDELYAFQVGVDPLADEVDHTSAEMSAFAQSLGMTNSELYAFLQTTEDSSTIVESLSRAAGASSADIASLGQGLANVGTVASQFGMDVDTTVATLAIFAENGIAGAEAGTMLKSMLLNMGNDTDTVVGAWNELGISLYDAEGNMRDVRTVMYEVDRALDQLPLEDQNRLSRDLAGSYGIVGFNALRAGTSIGEMQSMMTEQASAADVAATMMGTFQNVMGSLGGSVESLQIAVFTPFMNDVLRPLVEQIIVVVNSITDWVRANPELVSTILKIAAAAIALGPTLFAVGKVISVIGGAIGLLANPFAWIAAAIAGLVFAFQNNFLGIRDIVMGFVASITEAFGFFQYLLAQGATPLEAFIGAVRTIFGDEAVNTLTGFITTIQTVFTSILGIIQPIVTQIVTVFQFFFDFLGQGFAPLSALHLAISTIFGAETAQFVTGFLTQLRDALIGVGNFITTSVIPAFQAFANWVLTEGLPAVVNFIQTVVVPAIGTLIDALVRVWNDVSPFLFSLFDWFVTTGVPIIMSVINDLMLPVIEFLITQLGNLWTTVSPFLAQLYDWFVTTGLPFIQTAITNAGTFIQGLIDIISGIWNTVEPFLSAFYDGVIGIFNGILDVAITPLTNALTGVVNTINSVQQGIAGFTSGVGTAISNFGQGVQDFFSGGTETRDSGGEGVAGRGYGIGPSQADNEIFVPRSNGNFLPNFMETVNAAVTNAIGGQRGGGGDTNNITIQANSYAEGQAAARGWSDFMEERRRRGT